MLIIKRYKEHYNTKIIYYIFDWIYETQKAIRLSNETLNDKIQSRKGNSPDYLLRCSNYIKTKKF